MKLRSLLESPITCFECRQFRSASLGEKEDPIGICEAAEGENPQQDGAANSLTSTDLRNATHHPTLPPNFFEPPTQEQKPTRGGNLLDLSGGTFKKCLTTGKWNPKCMCLFSNLTDNMMITNIMGWLGFSDLLSAQSVSKRWFFSANHRSLWAEFDATHFVEDLFVQHQTCHLPSKDVVQVLNSVLRKHANLIHKVKVVRNNDIGLPGEAVEGLRLCRSVDWGKGLRSIELQNWPELGEVEVRTLFAEAKGWDEAKNRSGSGSGSGNERLNLGGDPNTKMVRFLRCPNVTGASIEAVVQGCPNLEVISLRSCRQVGSEGAPPLLKLRNKLKTIDLGMTKIKAADIFGEDKIQQFEHLQVVRMGGTGESWSNNLLVNLAKCAPKITEIEINCRDPFTGANVISDEGLLNMADLHGGNLQKMNFSGHKAITGAGIAGLLSTCRTVKELRIGGCAGALDVDFFLWVGETAGDLEVLVCWRSATSFLQFCKLFQYLSSSRASGSLLELDCDGDGHLEDSFEDDWDGKEKEDEGCERRKFDERRAYDCFRLFVSQVENERKGNGGRKLVIKIRGIFSPITQEEIKSNAQEYKVTTILI